jgi:phthalate 4,5-dioxygenase oxygenase subunit
MVKLRGNRDNNYGQDRNLMSAGHFTGFSQNIVEEDVVVQVSMGPIVDRTKEFLSESDVAIVQMRRSLLKSLREFEAGRLPLGSALADKPACPPIPVDTLLQPGMRWEDFSYDQAAA